MDPKDDTKESVSDKSFRLSKDEIRQIAEAFLILEGWQKEHEAQGDLSNSKKIRPKKKK